MRPCLTWRPVRLAVSLSCPYGLLSELLDPGDGGMLSVPPVAVDCRPLVHLPEEPDMAMAYRSDRRLSLSSSLHRERGVRRGEP